MKKTFILFVMIICSLVLTSCVVTHTVRLRQGTYEYLNEEGLEFREELFTRIRLTLTETTKAKYDELAGKNSIYDLKKPDRKRKYFLLNLEFTNNQSITTQMNTQFNGRHGKNREAFYLGNPDPENEKLRLNSLIIWSNLTDKSGNLLQFRVSLKVYGQEQTKYVHFLLDYIEL